MYIVLMHYASHLFTIFSYLLSMQSAKDVEEYLSELLGTENPGAKTFRRELLSHWKPPRRVPTSLSPQEGQILEELTRPPQEDMVLFRGEGGGLRSSGKAQKKVNRNLYSLSYMYMVS